MPDDYKSVDEWINDYTAPSLDEWAKGGGSTFLPVDEWIQEQVGLKWKKYKDYKRLQKRPTPFHLFEQFGRGAAQEASFGLTKYAYEDKPPEGTTESIARGLGQLAGFFVPLGVAGKAVKYGTKGAGLAARALGLGGAGAKIFGTAVKTAGGLTNVPKTLEALTLAQKAARLGGQVARTTATLSLAETLSDISEPETMLQRASHGAKIGAIFGAAGFITAKAPLLSFVLRQGGGRALMAIGGEYDPEMLKPENLAQTIYSEALLTFFLRKGYTPEQVMSGQMINSDKALLEQLQKEVAEVNQYTEPGSKWYTPLSFWKGPKVKQMNINDIGRDPGLFPDRTDVERYTQQFAGGINVTKTAPMDVAWDPVRKQYMITDRPSLYEAIKLGNIGRKRDGLKEDYNVNVRIVRPSPEDRPQLPNPLKVLAQAFRTKRVDAKVLEAMTLQNYFAINIDTRAIRMVRATPETGKVKLGPREVLLEKTGESDTVTNKLLFKAIGRGSKVPPFKFDGTKIFTGFDFIARREEALLKQTREGILQDAGKPIEELMVDYNLPNEKPNWQRAIRGIDGTIYPAKKRNALGAEETHSEIVVRLVNEGVFRPDVSYGDGWGIPREELVKRAGIPEAERATPERIAEQEEIRRQAREEFISPPIEPPKAQALGIERGWIDRATGEWWADPSGNNRPIHERTGLPWIVPEAKQKAIDALTEIENIDNQINAIYTAGVLRDEKLIKGYVPYQGKQSIEKVLSHASAKLNAMYKTPNVPLPKEYIRLLEERINNLGVGITLEQLKSLTGLTGTLRIGDMFLIEDRIINMESLPIEDRLGYIGSTIRADYNLEGEPLSGDLKEHWNRIEAISKRKRRIAIARAKHESETRGGTIMQHLLTYGKFRYWQDAMPFFAKVQETTNLPLMDIHYAIAGARQKVVSLLGKDGRILEKYKNMPVDSQTKVALFMEQSFAGLETKELREKFTPMEGSFIEDLNTLMDKAQPLVLETLYRDWFYEVYRPREARGGIKDPHEKQFFTNQKKIEPMLEEIAQSYDIMESDWASPETRTQATMNWLQWVERARGMGIASVAKGFYLPRFLVKSIKGDITMDDLRDIGYMGKGHLETRTGVIQDFWRPVDLLKSLNREFTSKNIVTRLHAYLNQVYSNYYVRPKIDALEKVVDVFADEMAKAKPPGFGRTVQEPKGMALLDYLKFYAHRMKGYPIYTEPVSEFLKSIQSGFFRALVVRPFMWARNLPQPFVNSLHKQNVYDPRFRFYAWRRLPQDVRDWFMERGVNQERALEHDYLMLSETERLKHYPGIGQFLGLAEKVGKVYALTDTLNRKMVFSPTFLRSMFYINKYIEGKIDINRLDSRLGIYKMDLPFQKMVLSEIQKAKNGDHAQIKEAAFNIAEYNDRFTNWMYRRTEKSLAEMTGEGESWTNLLTFAKGATQQMAGAMNRISEGWQFIRSGDAGRGWLLARSGVSQIAGVMLAGAVANMGLNILSLQQKAKYQSYGIDMFTWELGGVSASILKDFTSQLSDLAGAVDAPPQEKRKILESVLKFFDNVGIRQMVPFAKNALAMVESITGRSYISPLYDKVTSLMYGYPKYETYVQRTIAEAFLHILWAYDPNKSAEVRKMVNIKMHDLEMKVVTEHGPLKEWYELALRRYRYLNDMFMRYEPYQAMKIIEEEQLRLRFDEEKKEEETNKMLYEMDRSEYLLRRK